MLWVLKELDTKTLCDMEWNVAMEEPHTRVVEREGDGQVAAGVDGLSITADWVLQII